MLHSDVDELPANAGQELFCLKAGGHECGSRADSQSDASSPARAFLRCQLPRNIDASRRAHA